MTVGTFVGKVMSLLFNVLSGFSVERGAWGLKPLARVTELKKKKINKINKKKLEKRRQKCG